MELANVPMPGPTSFVNAISIPLPDTVVSASLATDATAFVVVVPGKLDEYTVADCDAPAVQLASVKSILVNERGRQPVVVEVRSYREDPPLDAEVMQGVAHFRVPPDAGTISLIAGGVQLTGMVLLPPPQAVSPSVALAKAAPNANERLIKFPFCVELAEL
jgi:hypothetical protein